MLKFGTLGDLMNTWECSFQFLKVFLFETLRSFTALTKGQILNLALALA